jgi:hypothetical protein
MGWRIFSVVFSFTFNFYQKRNNNTYLLSVEVELSVGDWHPTRGDSLLGKEINNWLCSDAIGAVLILTVNYPLFLPGDF